MPRSVFPPLNRAALALADRASARAAVRIAVGAAVLAAAAALPLTEASAQTLSGVPRSRSGDYIVAVVNTESVTQVEVQQRLDRVLGEARRAGARLPPEDELRQQALDALIDDRVLVTFARDTGNKVDEAELDRAVANIAAQNQLTVAQLRERLKTEGFEYPRFRNNLRDQILVERLREREVATRIRVADTEIDQLVEQQRSKAAAEVQLNVAQILVALPEGATDAVVAERRARALQLLARLRQGEDFAKLAAEASEGANKDQGGALGLRKAERLPDLFVEAVKSLKAGELAAEPVRSAAGFHLLKLLERQEGGAFKVTQTRARHILMRVSDRGDPAAAEAVVRRMAALRAEIERGGRRFEQVAKEVSEDGSAEAGGDLGWTSPGSFVPEFEDAMGRLAVGGLSAPVVSRFGVHLIQVVDRRDVQLEPKEVREQARNLLREQKYDQAYQDWVKELRLRAYVELREPPT